MPILAGVIVTIASLIGIVLTVLTLPGIWLAILVAVLCQWWQGNTLFSWWTLGVAFGLGLLAELVELVASAAGATKAGGTRRGAIGSIIGGLVGALLGTAVPPPPFGTILGGAIGAGAGALLAERHGGRKTWRESARIGQGAAVGRLVATVLKTVFAVAVALILSIAAFVD